MSRLRTCTTCGAARAVEDMGRVNDSWLCHPGDSEGTTCYMSHPSVAAGRWRWVDLLGIDPDFTVPGDTTLTDSTQRRESAVTDLIDHILCQRCGVHVTVGLEKAHRDMHSEIATLKSCVEALSAWTGAPGSHPGGH